MYQAVGSPAESRATMSKTEQQPKKPSLWSRIANSDKLNKIGTAIGEAMSKR